MRLHLPAMALLALLICAPLCPGPAAAQGSDVDSLMVARDVAVDATAETAVAARSIALEDGQRRAFVYVLRRIVLREDWARLPQPDGEALADLVEALEIDDEKTSAVRYLAKLTVRFKAAEMRALLRASGIPYTETRSKPVLLLPVLEQAGALSLFEPGNPWQLAWQGLEVPEDSLLPVRLPAGDLRDVTGMGPELAVAADTAALQAIGERYGSETVIVVHAIVAPDHAAGGVAKADVLRHWFGGPAANVVISSYRGEPDETVADLLRRVAAAELAELEETWKRRTLQTFGQGSVLSVRVPLGSLSAWLSVRNRLERIGMVRRFELRSISRADAQLVLHVSGDPTRLDVSLAQQDLRLVDVDGYWELRPREAPGGATGTGQ